MPDGPIPPRAQSLDPAGAAAVPPPADRVPPPPPPSSGDTANQPDTPALVRGVQLWMALDLWSALGREPADFEAVVGIDGWADTWAELNGAVRDLVAEHAKTVSNFEEFAEVTAEQLADARHELEVLRRINRELNDGGLYATQLILDAQRERDEARAERDRERTEHAQWSFEAGRQAGEFISGLQEQIAALTADLAQARRDAASWEDWGRGWKTQAEASLIECDKAWAELDRLRAGPATGPDGPRRWAHHVPAEPGPDVLAVQIVETGQRWERRYAKGQPDRWAWGHWLLGWSQLLSAWAVGHTLTDATPPADEARSEP